MIRQSNENNCQRYSSPQKNIQERYFKNKMQLNHCVYFTMKNSYTVSNKPRQLANVKLF